MSWDGRWVAEHLDFWHYVGMIDVHRYHHDAEYHARWQRVAQAAAHSHRSRR